MRIVHLLLVALLLSLPVSGYAADAPQSPLKSPDSAARHYPKIVLYSTSWCPHCKAVKEYFTRNEIPFINRDVEVDDEAMQLLTEKYKSKGVPVIVIGDDQVVMKGFDKERFEQAVAPLMKK